LEDFDRFREVGAIARRVRDEACRMISEGIKVIEICEAVEDMTREMSSKIRRPALLNLSPDAEATNIPCVSSSWTRDEPGFTDG